LPINSMGVRLFLSKLGYFELKKKNVKKNFKPKSAAFQEPVCFCQ
jgi:hypothetical protein